MAKCECLPKCPFFNDMMSEKPAMANLMKETYCLDDNSKCARHQVFEKVGAQNVPDDLFPSQNYRVEGILNKINSKAN
ncbi:MAG: hypothetical protein BKP49_04740 [Treponema sp. CETP13]|nr:MAG: hypothetical protein BKP49_04740 [Treponema sp. CETP13]